jgi:hypothetical protein
MTASGPKSLRYSWDGSRGWRVGRGLPPANARTSFDLVHSEGALYFVGVENGLRLWRGLLKPRGCITFTEAVWRQADPPEELRAIWWDDFYTPMEERVRVLRSKYGGDVEALAALDLIGREVELHRRYSGYYAYEFFAVRRSD